MNINKKLIAFLIFFSILILSILNIKNPEKTKFYFFTSKIEQISLGNLFTISFISGFTLSSLLFFVSKNNSQVLLEDNLLNNEEVDKYDENKFSKDLETNRPPERDVRESQPTISVNYRFVDKNNKSYGSKKTRTNLTSEENDWANYDNEW